MLVSSFLPIGPLGQGGAAIIQLGIIAKNINWISPAFGQFLHGAGIFIALIMWAYALLWIVFAVVSIAARFPRIQFSMAWWGFTFPLGMSLDVYSDIKGTFSLCSSQLGKTLGFQFFNVVACVVTICVILLWSLVATRTFIEGWRGEIFYAPCLASVGDRISEPIELRTASPVRSQTSMAD